MLSANIAASRRRWDELMANVASLIPAGPVSVLVDGAGEQPAIVAGRLAAALNVSGRHCLRVPATGHRIVLADGADRERSRRRDVVIWLRAAGHGMRGGEAEADIVIDLHDWDWPVIRRVAAPLASNRQWYVAETRAFFTPRAATWDTKFGDDLPAYAAAIVQAGLPAWPGRGRRAGSRGRPPPAAG